MSNITFTEVQETSTQHADLRYADDSPGTAWAYYLGGYGNDLLDGNDGSDTAAYSGLFGNYSWN